VTLTADEIRAINRKALDNLQVVTDALWGHNYAPSWLAQQLNPEAERAMGQFSCSADGAWMDMGHEGRARYGDVQGHGRDLISLVAYCGSCDRETAAFALRDLVGALPPPVRPLLQPDFGGREAGRPEPTVKPVRALRRP
jgi:hypothetical protein